MFTTARTQNYVPLTCRFITAFFCVWNSSREFSQQSKVDALRHNLAVSAKLISILLHHQPITMIAPNYQFLPMLKYPLIFTRKKLPW